MSLAPCPSCKPDPYLEKPMIGYCTGGRCAMCRPCGLHTPARHWDDADVDVVIADWNSLIEWWQQRKRRATRMKSE
jgi:hypothetical protein